MSDVCSSDLLSLAGRDAKGRQRDRTLASRPARLRRSEEGRGGKEGRSRWAPDPLKKKKTSFRPAPGATARLLPSEIGDLNRLSNLGFTSWLPAEAVAQGVYYGIRVGGRLVAAAGTHVISEEARLGVVGNVM